MKLKALALLFIAGALSSPSNAQDDKLIWLQAGQCVVLGGQQVCAQKAPDSGTPSANPCPSTPVLPNKVTHYCKNGIKDEANPRIKGWGHVIVTRSPDGKKLSEEVEKTYGPLGKKECMADAEKANGTAN